MVGKHYHFPTFENLFSFYCFISLKPLNALRLLSFLSTLPLPYFINSRTFEILHSKENSSSQSLNITGIFSLPLSIIEHSFTDYTSWAHHQAFHIINQITWVKNLSGFTILCWWFLVTCRLRCMNLEHVLILLWIFSYCLVFKNICI